MPQNRYGAGSGNGSGQATPPAVLPVSVAEVKQQLNIEHSASDDLIDLHLMAAVDLIDNDGYLGRAMITQTWQDCFPNSLSRARLRMTPFQSLDAVQYYDTEGALQTATLDDFDVYQDGDFVSIGPKSGASWPRADDRPDAIKITYTVGFGDAPEDVPQGIRHAIMMIAAYWYERRLAASDVSLSEAPMAVEALLNRHRLRWYG